jgi:hypothetical protein
VQEEMFGSSSPIVHLEARAPFSWFGLCKGREEDVAVPDVSPTNQQDTVSYFNSKRKCVQEELFGSSSPIVHLEASAPVELSKVELSKICEDYLLVPAVMPTNKQDMVSVLTSKKTGIQEG